MPSTLRRGGDEELAARLDRVERIGGDGALFSGEQRAGEARDEFGQPTGRIP